jgi:hypothetical protein
MLDVTNASMIADESNVWMKEMPSEGTGECVKERMVAATLHE